MTSATARRAACSCCVLGCCFDTWRALSGRCFAQPGMSEKSYFRVASVFQFLISGRRRASFYNGRFFVDILCGATRCRVMSRTQGCAAAQSLRGGGPAARRRSGKDCSGSCSFQMRWVTSRMFFQAPGLPVVILFWGSPRCLGTLPSSVRQWLSMFTSPGPYSSVEWSARMRRPREQLSARKLRRPFEHGRSREFL